MNAPFQSDQNAQLSMMPSHSVETKAPAAFRTISEVAMNLDVPQHVLRFWESKFQQVRPLKRGGGRRYYRPEDIDLLSNIKELLYNQGFTIRGVQKLLRDTGKASLTRISTPSEAAAAPVETAAAPERDLARLSVSMRREVNAVLGDLKTLREMLRESGV